MIVRSCLGSTNEKFLANITFVVQEIISFKKMSFSHLLESPIVSKHKSFPYKGENN